MKTRPVPVYKIDLSLPPSERYVELASLYRDQMRSVVGLFDELVGSVHPRIPLKAVHWLARWCLRRLHSREETEELRGISRATGIEMHLLVAFNVLLDLLMGCTSGGVRVAAGGCRKMMHFRTLDWGMDPLRDLVVHLRYVRSPQSSDTVLASSITYVGFTGVLTGVRKRLSVSLNFRPVHDARKNLKFYSNHLLVLLGFRRSISSLLRQCILPGDDDRTATWSWTRRLWRKHHHRDTGALSSQPLKSIVDHIHLAPTTAAYLIFSDGLSTVTMEKDYRSAVVRSSSSFIVVTNHDQEPDAEPTEAVADDKRQNHAGLTFIASELQSMADLIEDSTERQGCMQAKWDQKVRRSMRARKRAAVTPAGPILDPPTMVKRVTRSSTKTQRDQDMMGVHQDESSPIPVIDATVTDPEDVCATQNEVVNWLTTYPVVNECTHYAAVMDPSEGDIVWLRKTTG